MLRWKDTEEESQSKILAKSSLDILEKVGMLLATTSTLDQ